MEGDLSLLSIPDLLQMICLGGYSRDIHLFDGQTQVGVIAIRNGRVDRCFGYGIWGEAAFFRLVNMKRGRYKVNEAQDMSASDATLTAYSWQELLMEAARQQDEAARAAQLAEASSGRVIPFPGAHVTTGTMSFDATGALGAAMLRETSPANPIADFDFSPILDSGLQSIPGGMSVAPPPASSPSSSAPASAPARSRSDTGKQAPQPARAHSDTGKQTPITAAPPAPAPASAPASTSPPDASSGAADSTADDVMHLLQEATACYLRRDLARAEALLQKCLELRPGDKRALQNLDRIRRKKPQ